MLPEYIISFCQLCHVTDDTASFFFFLPSLSLCLPLPPAKRNTICWISLDWDLDWNWDSPDKTSEIGASCAPNTTAMGTTTATATPCRSQHNPLYDEQSTVNSLLIQMSNDSHQSHSPPIHLPHVRTSPFSLSAFFPRVMPWVMPVTLGPAFGSSSSELLKNEISSLRFPCAHL